MVDSIEKGVRMSCKKIPGDLKTVARLWKCKLNWNARASSSNTEKKSRAGDDRQGEWDN